MLGMQFVCGFAFNATKEYVALLKKEKFPPWIVGKWNGIGGRMEQGEGIRQAMVREFREEAGAITRIEDWTTFHSHRFTNGNICHMLCARLDGPRFNSIRQMESEPVECHNVASVLFDMAEDVMMGKGETDSTVFYMPLAYLIPMASLTLGQPMDMRNMGY